MTPGCRAQPVEFSEPERTSATEEADRYDAWVEGIYEAHCKEPGLNPETGEPGAGYTGPAWRAEWDPGQQAEMEGN